MATLVLGSTLYAKLGSLTKALDATAVRGIEGSSVMKVFFILLEKLKCVSFFTLKVTLRKKYSEKVIQPKCWDKVTKMWRLLSSFRLHSRQRVPCLWFMLQVNHWAKRDLEQRSSKVQESWSRTGKDRISRGERLPDKDLPYGIYSDVLDRTEWPGWGRQVDVDKWQLTGKLRQLGT